MKMLRILLFGAPESGRKRKKAKKRLLPALLDRVAGIPVNALEAKWKEDLWKPDF